MKSFQTALWVLLGLLSSVAGVALLQQGQPTHKPLRVGDRAPDFTLKFLNSNESFTLSHNFGKKPTFLIFGSYT